MRQLSHECSSTKSPPIRVLHLFGEYLFYPETWSYQLIKNIPNTDIIIGARTFLRKNCYFDDFEYIEYPFRLIDMPKLTLIGRILNRLIRPLLRLYPLYLRYHAENIDITHAHFGDIGWEYRRLPGQIGALFVVSFYGYDYGQYPKRNPIWLQRYRELFDRADIVCCEGQSGKNQLLGLGCPASKIRIIRLGVDIKEIPYLKRLKNKNELHLVQVASFVEKKGHFYTVEAFLKALASCPNMTLTLVGEQIAHGTYKQILSMIKNSQGKDRIRVLNYIDYRRLHLFLKDFHVFVQPSCFAKDGDCEGGAPIALLDAQATGMPVVATWHCDIPEEVLDQKTGILCDEKDIDALTHSIKYFYSMQQEEYDYFADQTRKHVSAHYDIRKNAKKLRDLYGELLTSSPDGF